MFDTNTVIMGIKFAASFGDSMKVITILVIVIGDVKAYRRKGNSVDGHHIKGI